MNIHEYISSGVLEAYALGALSEQERAEVENNLALYPELKSELAQIEATQEKMLMKAAVKPRAAVRAALFEKITDQPSGAKVVPVKSAESNTWKYAAAAAVVLAVVSTCMAVHYHGKWRDTEASLKGLIAQNQRMAQDYDQVTNRLDRIEKEIDIFDNPAFKRVIMKGTANAPASMAYVYWNESTKEVYLSIQIMKELSENNQYQLWAIIDGKPVDAGVFDADISGLLKMKDIGAGAVTFAVTIEPRGGKESPSLETMQVAGNVVKS